MAISDYSKFLDLSQIPEKTSFESTDKLAIQNVNEENAQVEKTKIIFPTEQLLSEQKYLDIQQNIAKTKAIVDDLKTIIEQDDYNEVQEIMNQKYGNLMNTTLSQITEYKEKIQEEIQQIDFENGTQRYVLGTHSDEYYDSGWVDITGCTTQFTHSLSSVPLFVSVKYKLKNQFEGWSQGTVFYNQLPIWTTIYGDDDIRSSSGGQTRCISYMKQNINQINDKIFVSLPYVKEQQLNPYAWQTVLSSSGIVNSQSSTYGKNSNENVYQNFQMNIIQYKRK